MLKPTDPASLPGPEDERPIGDLVHELIDHGKAYAKAEVEVAKAIAAAKADAVRGPAIMLGVALVLTIAAMSALAVGVLLALEPLIGPILAGLAAFLLFGGIAGALTWTAANRLKDSL